MYGTNLMSQVNRISSNMMNTGKAGSLKMMSSTLSGEAYDLSSDYTRYCKSSLRWLVLGKCQRPNI